MYIYLYVGDIMYYIQSDIKLQIVADIRFIYPNCQSRLWS